MYANDNNYSYDLTEFKFYLFNKSLSFSEIPHLLWIQDYLDYVKLGISDYESSEISRDKVSYTLNDLLDVDFKTNITRTNFQDENIINILNDVINSIDIALQNGNLPNAAYYIGFFTGAFFDISNWAKIVNTEFFNEIDQNTLNFFNSILSDIDYESDFFKSKFDSFFTYDKALFYSGMENSLLYFIKIIFQGEEREHQITYTIRDYFNNLPDFNEFLYRDNNVTFEDLNDEYISNLAKTYNISTNHFFHVINHFSKPDTKPAAEIRNLNVIEKDEEVVLYWRRSPDYNKLVEQLLYINRGRGWEEPLTLSPSETRFNIGGLINEKQYFFKITTMRPENNESNGVIISATPRDTKPPLPISNLNASAGNRQVKLNWRPSRDRKVTFQHLYISEDNEKYEKYDKLSPEVNSYLIDKLNNLTKYYFKITTIDKVPNESEGVIAYAVPEDTVPPEPVSNLVLHPQSERIKAVWKPSPNTEGDAEYQIIILYKNDVVHEKIKIDDVTLSSYEFTGLKNDISYSVSIVVLDDAMNESKEVIASAMPTAVEELFVRYTGNDIPFDVERYVLQNKINIPNKTFVYLDYNNNGRTDIILVNEQNSLVLLENIDGLNYTNVSQQRRLSGQSRVNSIVTADLNNNGWTDIIVATSGFWEETVKVFMNNKGEYFQEKSEQLNLNIPGENTFITLFDINNDGFQDIYLSFAEDARMKGMPNNMLFLNSGNGKFTRLNNHNLSLGLNTNYAVSADFNMNGYCDIYISNQNGLNRFFVNRGNNTFIDKTEAYKFNDKSGVPVVIDYDNDGDYDLLIFDTENYNHVFYENQTNTHRFIKFDIINNFEKFIGAKFVLKEAGTDKIISIKHISYSDIPYRPSVHSVIFALENTDIAYDIEIIPVALDVFNYLNIEPGRIIKLN